MTFDMNALLKQAQEMQEQMQQLQEEAAKETAEASAGGGMVTVKMDGHKNVTGVKIDPEAASDVEMLQDLIQVACNDATKKVEEESQKKMGGMLAGLGLPPGMF